MNRNPLLRAAALAAVVLLPASALAATPSVGVPQEIRTGLFTDVNLGAFLTLGGKDQNGASGASNAQAYLQLGLGYDLTRNIGVAASFGLGSSAASCFAADISDCYPANSAKAASLPDNFTATMFMLEGSYKFFFNERLTLAPRLHVGYATLNPGPTKVATTAGEPSPSEGGFVIGAGAGIEYATHMDHFSIGADFYGRYITGPNIFALAIYPKVKYTF